MIVDTSHEMAAVSIDCGKAIMTKAYAGGKSNDEYPLMNFRWIEGKLRWLTVNFTFNDSWTVVRNSEGKHKISDGFISDYIRKKYGGQIPLTIREGGVSGP